jgi:hypothetical protein
MVNFLQIFPDISQATGSDSTWYGNKSVEGLQPFQLTDESTPIDYALFMLTSAWLMIIWMFRILTAIFWLYPLLANVIGIPAPLSAALQVGLWVIWVIGFMGIRSGTNPDNLR